MVRNTQGWVGRTTSCLGATYLIANELLKIEQAMRAHRPEQWRDQGEFRDGSELV